jgi:ribose/xylose/arabinose/galactoside ABC-type transport system permease subunit
MFSIIFLIVAIFFPWFILSLLVGGIAGIFVGGAAVGIARTFSLPLLGISLSCACLAALLFANSTPNPDSPFMNVSEAIAQSHVFGAPVPIVVAVVAVLLFVASLARGLSRPAH